MGNCVCVFKGKLGEVEEKIKVVTSNGGIMELYAPITAEFITNDFPGHAIFQKLHSSHPHHHHHFSQPLLHNQELLVGQLYYLLPLNTNNISLSTTASSSSLSAVPYRMSFDNQRLQKRSSDDDHEVFPRYNNRGVWKVKLVISPEQLSEILSQEKRTEALIESVRTVAKCGNGISTAANSDDQWSLSSSLKASSDK